MPKTFLDENDRPGGCLPSLKLTSKAPENEWLEDDPFLLGFGLFSGAFAVSFRECFHDFGWELPEVMKFLTNLLVY